MEFNTPSKTLTFTFDSKYLKLKNVPPENFAELAAWLKTKSKDPRRWMSRLNSLKPVMDAWFNEHPKGERRVQQKLAERNSFANGRRCQVMDLELAIPLHRELGRTALKRFREHRYNFVLMSSTKLDSCSTRLMPSKK